MFSRSASAAFLALSLLAAVAQAWTTSSRVSGFGGSVLVTGVASESNLCMKKGKPNVPVQMRGQYRRQQEMQQMREQMISASKPGEDGLPVFNLFVQTDKSNVSVRILPRRGRMSQKWIASE